MGMAGVTSFSEGGSKITFSPGNVVILCIAVMVIVVGMHAFL